MANSFSPVPTPDVKQFPFSIQEWLRQFAYFALSGSLPTTASRVLSNKPEHVLVDATASAVVISLPAISNMPTNQIVEKHFKKTDVSGNTVTITPSSGNTVEGAGTYVLSAQYESVTLYTNGIGTAWYIKAAT
jgi:hypothetical protein